MYMSLIFFKTAINKKKTNIVFTLILSEVVSIQNLNMHFTQDKTRYNA